jgi:hypothetical protein
MSNAREKAIEVFETFHARPFAREVKCSFEWPDKLQNIGEAKAQMYRSNKWKMDKKQFEEYKHNVESKQICYATPGFLCDWDRPSSGIKTYGPMVELPKDLPDHFTILGDLIGLQIKLNGPDGKLPRGDKNFFEVVIARAKLGTANYKGKTVLFAYTKAGIHVLIMGTSLRISRDGIQG